MFILEALKTHAKTDKIALINRQDPLTFSELDARSQAFAACLLERFGGDRSPVVIYGHKENDFLPCVFGALKAGHAYVPLDTATPPIRAAEIIREVGPQLVVNLSAAQLECDAVVLEQDALRSIIDRPPTGGISEEHWVSGRETAYILFTSGSTGKPKGVSITADNLANFYRGLLPYLTKQGVILNQISYSFDVSCCSIYVGLAQGMTLFTIDNAMMADMKAFYAGLGRSGLTTWVSTPSFAELCVCSRSFSAELLPQLKQFLFCGEVLTHKLCDQLAERFPQAEILNTYGPTEATVLVTAMRVSEEMRRDSRPIPIGRPLEEVQLRLVDAQGRAVEQDGAEGELLILSDSVGLGYLHRPDLTAKRFFDDPQSGKRGYRSGDICYQTNGLYYYQGRADNQLKLSGHRIELEDIESNLAQLDNIARAAVIPVYEQQQAQYLVAFLLLEQVDGLTSLQRSMAIRRQAAELLPAYMIPRKFVVVEAFPLNINGKVDRQSLAGRLEKAGSP